MAIAQMRSRRKVSGGRYKVQPTKRSAQLGSEATLTKIGETKKRVLRTLAGHRKFRLLTSDTANVLNPKTKAYKVVKIKTVVDSPANSNYIRRNIITRGTIIDTELGKAKVTSRPGQDSAINAVLI